jgi:hypothetical protein
MLPDMQIGADGIWRLGRIVPASSRSGNDNPLDVGDICLREAERFADKFAAVTPSIASGKYATTRAVVDALFPEGSPMAQTRKMQERDAVVVQVITDVPAGKYLSVRDVSKALSSGLSKIDGAHVDWGGELTTE